MAITRVRWKRGTAADWTSANPVLRLAEPGWETDTQQFKVGDGVTAWVALDYVVTAGGGGGGGFDDAALAATVHAATGKTSIADADELALVDSAASNGLKKVLGSVLKTVMQGQIAPGVHLFSTKATPVDADEFGYNDSAATFAGKRATWANLKSALKAQISLDQWVAPAAAVSMNSKKLTALQAGTAGTDAVNLDQMTTELGDKLDLDLLLDAYLDLMTGTPRMIAYDTGTSSWPTLDTTTALDPRVSWIFLYSDEGDPPPGSPTVAGLRLWARLVTP